MFWKNLFKITISSFIGFLMAMIWLFIPTLNELEELKKAEERDRATYTYKHFQNFLEDILKEIETVK